MTVVAIVGALVALAAVIGLVVVDRDRRRALAEVERLQRRWDELAAADVLTGLGNRTRLLEDVQTLIARGSRYGNAFGLVLFEVPGTLTDDELQAVAEVIAAEARSADLCYRIGARLFAVVLAEQDLLGAGLAADRIGVLLQELGHVDVRRGVAGFSPWLEAGAAELLLRAERDLRGVGDSPPGDPVTPPS